MTDVQAGMLGGYAVQSTSARLAAGTDGEHEEHPVFSDDEAEQPDSEHSHSLHYHGHRAATFVSHDIDELTELRARRELTHEDNLNITATTVAESDTASLSMTLPAYSTERTFEGAYQRTALGMAAYAIIVLKIFSDAFAAIGICYVAMAALLLIVSYVRKQRSKHDFADENMPPSLPSEDTAGRKPKRLWGRNFRTVGNLVVFLVLCIGGLEVAILVILMRL